MPVIEIDDEDDEEPNAEVERGNVEEDFVEEEAPQISIHVIRGTLHCSMMKLEGMVQNRRLQILIDSGSTHNFLDVSIAE